MVTTLASKTCCVCRQMRSVEDFARDKSKADGRQYRCRSCDATKNRVYRSSPGVRHQARTRSQNWKRENRGAVSEQKKARRAALRGSKIASLDGFAAVLRSDPCSYCSARSSTIDHIVPLYAGGEHSNENLTGACLVCNSRKGTKSLLQFLSEQGV